MKNNEKTAQNIIVGLAFISVAYKISIFYFDLQLSAFRNTDTFLNILLCLLSVFFTIFYFLKQSPPGNTFVDVFKVGVRGAVLFAFIIASFNLIYFKYIDTSFLQNMIYENAREYVKLGEDKKKIIEYVISAKTFMTPYQTAFLTFFTYLFSGLLYSLFITLLFAKVNFFQKLVID
jgi:hypothetical protein